MAVTKKQQVNIVHHCDSHLCSRPFLEASLSAFVSSAILSSMFLYIAEAEKAKFEHVIDLMRAHENAEQSSGKSLREEALEKKPEEEPEKKKLKEETFS